MRPWKPIIVNRIVIIFTQLAAAIGKIICHIARTKAIQIVIGTINGLLHNIGALIIRLYQKQLYHTLGPP